MVNIPNVGNNLDALMNGIKTGSNFYTGIMNPILKREHEKQMAEQFGITNKRQAEQFAQQMALRKQQEGRMAQMQRLQMQQLRNKLDPNYEFNQFKALQDKIMGTSQPGGMQQPQQPVPNQEMGEGMGMFSPQGMQEAQQTPQQQPQAQGGTFDALKQNPMLRGFFKHKFGFDPLAAVPQTPEQKNASALDLYRQKEAIKSEKEEKMPAAIKTLHENIIHLSPKAIDAIDHIINIPSPTEIPGTGFIKSGQKAAHNKAVTAAAENYSKANGWPNTKGSIEKAESILQRGNFETDYDYHKRLRGLQEELRTGIKTSNQFLHPNQAQAESNNKSNDPLGIR